MTAEYYRDRIQGLETLLTRSKLENVRQSEQFVTLTKKYLDLLERVNLQNPVTDRIPTEG